MNLISKENKRVKLGLVNERPVPRDATHDQLRSTPSSIHDDEEVNEFEIIKTVLDELLKSVQEVQQNVFFIKSRYIKPLKRQKNRISKEQRKGEIINKMLTRGKKVY
jgi:hypothetical protein